MLIDEFLQHHQGGSGGGVGPTVATTADHNAVAGELLALDLRAAAITVTLPATPAALAIVRMRDLFGSAATYNLTVARNGHSIGGVAENLTVATNNFDFELIYDGVSNWQITRFQ